jgi:hypothetical protein
MSLPIILVAIGSLLLGLALRSLRRHRLKERYALLFIGAGVPFLALAAWPDAVGRIAAWLGIEYHTVLLLVVTTFFLLVNFKLLSLLSVQERRIASLTQLLAILQHRMGRPAGSAPAERIVHGEVREKDVA